MTPQEKAKRLFDEMYKNCTMTIAGAGSLWKPLCKKQCLIVVAEILNELVPIDFSTNDVYHQLKTYWQQVKEEIQKL